MIPQTGKLYINDSDAWTRYKAWLPDGQLAKLIQYPKLKTPDATEWAELFYTEYDLTTLLLDTRTVNLDFCLYGDRGRYETFGSRLETYPTMLEVPLLDNATWTLRFTGFTNIECCYSGSSGATSLYKMTAQFSEDNPVTPTDTVGSTKLCADSSLSISGVNISYYGARLEGDTWQKALNPYAVREGLKVTTCDKQGVALYHAAGSRLKSTAIKIPLVISGCTAAEAFRRYRMIMNTLLDTSKTHRIVYYGVGHNYFYQSSSVDEFHTSYPALLKITLTMQLCK